MKGFPRRGSDGDSPVSHPPCLPGLNEGLPQKGKRSLRPDVAGLAQRRASMKGFPRRGSDFVTVVRSGATRVIGPQ